MARDGDEVGSFSWIVGLHAGGRVGDGLRDHFSCEHQGKCLLEGTTAAGQEHNRVPVCERTYQQEWQRGSPL